MTILLYKNGQWHIDGEQPLEGVSLDNLAAILTNPKDGDTVKYDEASGMWVAGQPGSSLPSVTSADNGKVLAVEDGAWAARNILVAYAEREGDSTLSPNISPAIIQPSYDDVRAVGENGGCIMLSVNHLLGEGYGSSVCVMYPYSRDEYTIMFRGTYTDFTADPIANYEIVAAFYDMEGSLSLTGQVKPLGKFIVTLTPTLPDYSGTMDKTPAEITAAYEAGQDIEFDVPSLSVKCKAIEFAVNDGIIQAGAIVTYRSNGSHLLIELLTHSTASEYFTSVYSLTPAS